MRKTFIAAAFWATSIVGANALDQGGIIVFVNDSRKTFTCHWGTRSPTGPSSELARRTAHGPI
jgi:hypothetical protein